VPYRGWFEERDGGPPLKVEAAATSADSWEAKAASPARWALGFPALTTAAWLWTDDATRERIGDDPSRRHPAAEPELEDFLDFVLKAWRRATAGDELGLRSFAQEAATRAPTLLIPLNAERVVGDRREALDAALSHTVAPDDFAADMTTCLGLDSASADEIGTALARLGHGMLAFLRERAPGVDPQPELAHYLAAGMLERHLRASGLPEVEPAG